MPGSYIQSTPTLNNRLRWDSANHLFIKLMICRDKIISLGKPCLRTHLEADGRVVVHYCLKK
jgi:hypothetical protein